ncbi:MAG TPA: ankyrin repeat domain-containing protein [Sedimentisphaerales bacterium]|nr:ankyrin repeat domain-containing protein [Sedimentisphaerales bacterium]
MRILSIAFSLNLLFTCLNRGNKDFVELLIAKGVDVNAKNNRGQTPLDIAVKRGHTEIAELLRKHGAKE